MRMLQITPTEAGCRNASVFSLEFWERHIVTKHTGLLLAMDSCFVGILIKDKEAGNVSVFPVGHRLLRPLCLRTVVPKQAASDCGASA